MTIEGPDFTSRKEALDKQAIVQFKADLMLWHRSFELHKRAHTELSRVSRRDARVDPIGQSRSITQGFNSEASALYIAQEMDLQEDTEIFETARRSISDEMREASLRRWLANGASDEAFIDLLFRIEAPMRVHASRANIFIRAAADMGRFDLICSCWERLDRDVCGGPEDLGYVFRRMFDAGVSKKNKIYKYFLEFLRGSTDNIPPSPTNPQDRPHYVRASKEQAERWHTIATIDYARHEDDELVSLERELGDAWYDAALRENRLLGSPPALYKTAEHKERTSHQIGMWNFEADAHADRGLIDRLGERALRAFLDLPHPLPNAPKISILGSNRFLESLISVFGKKDLPWHESLRAQLLKVTHVYIRQNLIWLFQEISTIEEKHRGVAISSGESSVVIRYFEGVLQPLSAFIAFVAESNLSSEELALHEKECGNTESVIRNSLEEMTPSRPTYKAYSRSILRILKSSFGKPMELAEQEQNALEPIERTSYWLSLDLWAYKEWLVAIRDASRLPIDRNALVIALKEAYVDDPTHLRAAETFLEHVPLT